MFASGKTAAVASAANYVEEVFSTYLYTGNGSTQTITNGIDLAGKGGMTWLKYRSGAASTTYHHVYDSARGKSGNTSYNYLYTNTTGPQGTGAFGPTSFNSDGFSLNSYLNESSIPYVSWTFRKQPKFFDVVTYTGNGSAGGQTLNHSLGSTPGCIIVKRTDTTEQWRVYHITQGVSAYAALNSTNAFATDANNPWKTPTSTTFGVGDGTYWTSLNASGGTYVAYLFAHNAGGFGLTGTDNVISCGSFTPSGGVATVNLGFEPQWILSKTNSTGYFWRIVDNMRGIPVSPAGSNSAKVLYPNSSNAEASSGDISPTATGFTVDGQPDFETIYIAIRRGPMKVPTSGTSVLQTLTYTGNGSSGRIYSGVTTVPDLAIATSRSNTSPKNWCDRLRGENPMISTSTDGESGTSQEGKTIIAGSANGTVTFGSYWGDASVNTNGYTYVNYLLSRAPSFFDEVCYTGTGSQQNITHNLGVAPELMIVKRRSAAGGSWATWATSLTADQSLALNTTDDKTAVFSVGFWGSTYPTSSVFTVGSNVNTNSNTVTYVAYLFATCAGVSKVGSYTGTGTTKQIDCGFTGGARFVLIKRTDSTGDWYVWDTARGIVSGNDPYLLLNSTAAETTGTDYIDTYSAGFEISSTAPAAINASGGTFIFLAIA